MHHISYLALKSPTIIDLGSLVCGVVISSFPSTLYILFSRSGLLLSHIRVNRVLLPSPKCICAASSDDIECLSLLPYHVHLHPLFYGRCGIRVSSD